jgi:NadR type nicotinamide-nucleotide adenylyltransferase
MLRKVSIVGPESSGKSTLAKALAAHFETEVVLEYAREYLEKLGRPYQESDLIDIAKGQLAAEQVAMLHANQFLFCDTNLLVIKIWSQVKYNRVNSEIMELMNLDSYDLHLLLAPDIPWEADPLREHPEFRNELFEIYHQELIASGVPFHIISGKNRLEQAVSGCADLLMC